VDWGLAKVRRPRLRRARGSLREKTMTMTEPRVHTLSTERSDKKQYVFLIAGRRSRRGWSGLGAGQSATPQAAASPRQFDRKEDDDDRTSYAHIEYGAQ
jgi:hypothetical protein